MERLLVEISIRALLIAGGTAVVLRATRITTPAARHTAWTAVLLLMLVLPLWTMMGPRLPVRAPSIASTELPMMSAPAPHVAATSSNESLQTAAVPASDAAPSGPPALRLTQVLLSIYLLVAGALVLRLALGTIQVQRLRRNAVLRDGRLTSALCATPITIGWLRPVVIMPRGWQGWRPEKIDAVLTHEREHARRRDPFIQWLTLLNRAVFWFHPVAWWLERKLTALAEEACDAAVLKAGHSPLDYSEYLVDIARSVSDQGRRVQLVGMAMPGSALRRRVRQILSGLPSERESRARIGLTAAGCALSSALFAAGSPASPAQQPPPDAPKFEAATVKINNSRKGQMDLTFQPGGRLTATNVTLQQLIEAAYDVQEFQLKGGPEWMRQEWLNSTKFDIEAKAPAADGDIWATPKDGGPRRGQLMLRALLADRFKLDVHTETRESPIYALELARSDRAPGPQLKLTKHDCEKADASAPDTFTIDEPSPCTMSRMPGTIRSAGLTMKSVAEVLSQMVERTVVDRTGLPGYYEFTLKWTPDGVGPGYNRKRAALGLEPIDENGPSLLVAVREQLGLKLDSQKGPVTVLVVDRASLPTPD